jgi:protein ImuA
MGGGFRISIWAKGWREDFLSCAGMRHLRAFIPLAHSLALTQDRTHAKNKTGTNSEFVPVRNNVPDGENVGEFLPSGVERAGGAGGEGLIEHLRERIRVLEQVPVSLAFPPAPDTGPLPRPACSLLSPVPSLSSPFLREPANSNPSPGKGEGGDGHRPSPGGGHAATIGSDSSRGRETPLHKLAANGLHEIKPAAYRDAPSALAFTLAFIGDRLTRREGASPLLWCLTERAAREWGAPYGPGLIAFGLDPALVLIVQARNAMDAAWALEEGLKAGAFIAALGQIEVKAPIIARRLGLAAQTSHTPCLLLSGHQGSGLPGTLTRWRVAAERTSGAVFDASAPGAPAWHLTLERCRGMAPARSWTVEFRDVAYGFRLAPRFADRAAEADETRQALSG